MMRSIAPRRGVRRESADHEWPDAAASSATFISAAGAAAPRARARPDPRAAPPRAAASISSSPPRTSRWLMNERAAIVDDVDLALDRDDVIAARAVDQVDERRHERALAARARSGDEHQAFRLDRERLDFARQPELIGRDRAARHQAEHAARPAMIAEAHAADAADVFDVADPLGRARPCAALRGCARASASAAAIRRRREYAPARRRASASRRRRGPTAATRTRDTASMRRAPRQPQQTLEAGQSV